MGKVTDSRKHPATTREPVANGPLEREPMHRAVSAKRETVDEPRHGGVFLLVYSVSALLTNREPQMSIIMINGSARDTEHMLPKTYTYDSNGRMKTQAFVFNGKTYTQTFNYDTAGNLTGESIWVQS